MDGGEPHREMKWGTDIFSGPHKRPYALVFSSEALRFVQVRLFQSPSRALGRKEDNILGQCHSGVRATKGARSPLSMETFSVVPFSFSSPPLLSGPPLCLVSASRVGFSTQVLQEIETLQKINWISIFFLQFTQQWYIVGTVLEAYKRNWCIVFNECFRVLGTNFLLNTRWEGLTWSLFDWVCLFFAFLFFSPQRINVSSLAGAGKGSCLDAWDGEEDVEV